jgi:ABC-type lipoprotein release transport system permease subunit
MTFFSLLKRNLFFYWKRNLAIAFGVAVCSAVIIGALMVGDSIKYNLNKIVSLRLGAITHSITAGDRFFSENLAYRFEKQIQSSVAPLLLLDGIAINSDGDKRVNKIQVIGIDAGFDKTAKTSTQFGSLTDDEVVISKNLAERLNLKTGDEVLLRIKRASLIPINTPFVSEKNATVPIRLKVKSIAGNDHLGRFHLRISQTAPFNAFVSLKLLNRVMHLKQQVNALVFENRQQLNDKKLEEALQKSWSLKDLNLTLKSLPANGGLQIASDRVFIEPDVIKGLSTLPYKQQKVLTYFVNSFHTAKGETPYSFISTLPDTLLKKDEIIINRWMADDLHVKVGDTTSIQYFVIGPLHQLTVHSSTFRIRDIVEISKKYADKALIPNIPGLTDAGDCKDWNTGVPIDLKKIRKKDEDYWNKWKGTPKAFIASSRAIELWKNDFGTYTAARLFTNPSDSTTIKQNLLKSISPKALNFSITPLMASSIIAANSGVDFSQLFSSLSFFILISGIILIVLLYRLNLEYRESEIKTLNALGISYQKIRNLILYEGLSIAVVGTLFGILLARLYTSLVFIALNSIWNDAVQTELSSVSIDLSSIAIGFSISIIVIFFTLHFTTTKFINSLNNHKELKRRINKDTIWKKVGFLVANISGLAAVILIVTQIINLKQINPTLFFVAGGLLLLSLLLYTNITFEQLRKRTYNNPNALALSIKSAIRNKRRSLIVITLFAIGTFIVLSTGLNRQDLFVNALDKSNGTGGFQYYAELTTPITKNLNNPSVKNDFGISETDRFIQISKHDGDDASCLNLNRIKNPPILGVPAKVFLDRFSFVSFASSISTNHSWLILNQKLPRGIIPAVADETVIKWGLGLSLGDTLVYTNDHGKKIVIQLVAGLANSIFQGNILISDSCFYANFPANNGSSILLAENNSTTKAENIKDELKEDFRDYGIEINTAIDRLAEFNAVENTYLSIFLVLGAFGLLLGTVGLGVVLVRSILERQKEIALMKAIGLSERLIANVFRNEYFILLFFGIFIGAVTSFVVILPTILNPNASLSFLTFAAIIVLLLANGSFWILFLTNRFLKTVKMNNTLRND